MRLIDADILYREVEGNKTSNPHKQSIVAQNHDDEHRHFLRMICDSETFDLEKHNLEIRADERAKVVKEIENECSDKDLNENIDWCIQTLSLFDVTDLNKKELCETLESQKAMIAVNDVKIRADERQKFAEWLEENDMLVRWEHDDEYVRNGVLNACNIIEMYEQRGVEK